MNQIGNVLNKNTMLFQEPSAVSVADLLAVKRKIHHPFVDRFIKVNEWVCPKTIKDCSVIDIASLISCSLPHGKEICRESQEIRTLEVGTSLKEDAKHRWSEGQPSVKINLNNSFAHLTSCVNIGMTNTIDSEPECNLYREDITSLYNVSQGKQILKRAVGEQAIRCPRKRNDEFSSLKSFLYVFFLQDDLKSQNIILSFNEIAILTSIIEKKLGHRLRISNIYTFSEIMNRGKFYFKRRTEDCFKLVFKQAYKHLQAKFEIENSHLMTLNPNKSKVIAFYEYYFGSTSRLQNVSLENYFLPLTQDCKIIGNTQVVAKTINTDYITLVTLSDKFLKDFTFYLQNKFLDDYRQLTIKRIEKMVKIWNETYAKSFCKNKAVDLMCDIIVNNKKNKFPWFIDEVERAVHIVMQNLKRKTVQNT